jgi:transposase-like protein
MPESGTYGSVRGVPGSGHSYRNPEMKAQVLAEREAPGASVAEVAMARGTKANVVHRWRHLDRESGKRTAASKQGFMPVMLAPVASTVKKKANAKTSRSNCRFIEHAVPSSRACNRFRTRPARARTPGRQGSERGYGTAAGLR